METKVKGCKELIDEVVDAGLCAYCGGCSGNCPYLIAYRGRIVLLDNCNIQDGQCYRYCPKTHTDMDAYITSFSRGMELALDALGKKSTSK